MIETLTSDEIVLQCRALTEGSAKPTVPDVLPLLDAYYRLPETGLGGAVHIIIEDDNIDDGDVDACIKGAQKECDGVGEAVARLLRRCSRTQRHKLYQQHGYPCPNCPHEDHYGDPCACGCADSWETRV